MLNMIHPLTSVQPPTCLTSGLPLDQLPLQGTGGVQGRYRGGYKEGTGEVQGTFLGASKTFTRYKEKTFEMQNFAKSKFT